MDDSNDFNICKYIRLQKESYKQINGRYPKCVILNHDIAQTFFAAHYNYVMYTEGAKFENPIHNLRQFEGMNLIVVSESYGGSFKWAFGD